MVIEEVSIFKNNSLGRFFCDECQITFAGLDDIFKLAISLCDLNNRFDYEMYTCDFVLRFTLAIS